MPNPRCLAVLLLTSTCALAADVSGAPAPPSPPGVRCPSSSPALAGLDAQARLSFVRARLRAEVAGARRWTGLFGAGFGLVTAGQLGLAQTTLARKRVDNYAASVALSIGFTSVATSAVHALTEPPSTVVPTSAEELCHVLADAELALQRGADGEALGSGVLAHAANVVINTALMLFLGFGYQHWGVGIFDFASGMVIGEALLLTQPRGLVGAYRLYQAGTF